ncbi:MAG: topoisomerase C-terminal repeat-containing protein [Ferrimicrobium acidiphilum]
MIKCPECNKEITNQGSWWRCDTCDKVTIWHETAKYVLTGDDVNAMANGGVTEIREFTSRAGKTFRASLAWNRQEHKVTFVFPEAKPSVEGALCPDHFVELRMSDKRYFCPTKIDDEHWCPVGMWRDYHGYAITPGDLEKLLLGLTVGPWTLTKRDGNTYEVMATFDLIEHKLVTLPVELSGPTPETPSHPPVSSKVQSITAPRATTSEAEAFDDTAS